MLNLRIPGPTPVPDSVAQAGAADMINHRGPEFADLIKRSTTQLKEVFETENDLFILTASGTGGMEAAVANHVNAGEKVLVVTVGVFGKRFVEIVRVFGGNPIELDFEFGRAADPNRIEEALQQHSDIRVVLVTHNETSTGVTNNDLKIVSDICQSYDCLLIVDAISSLSSIPVKTDEFTSSTNDADVTGLSVNITPSSSTSKILVMAQVTCMSSNTACGFKLNGTAL